MKCDVGSTFPQIKFSCKHKNKNAVDNNQQDLLVNVNG